MSTRKKIVLVLGVLVLVVGIAFVIIGTIDFFTDFFGEESKSLFWTIFVGMVFVFVATALIGYAKGIKKPNNNSSLDHQMMMFDQQRRLNIETENINRINRDINRRNRP